ncbi:MAG: hypothetical protein C5B52_01735 [Bacteroidetes bacterium]|nr:MAG: hypothetical protein C5B52_01735 [Bacteroidota bacterium]
MPDSYSYIAEMGIILTIYIFIVILVTKFSTDRYILGVSTLFGVMAAILEIVHISIENFGHLNGHAEAVSTGIFMITLFLIFGVSGFYIAIRTKKISSGVWGGSWSAVVCMLLVMTYGLSQLFWSFAAIEKHNIGNPDFIRTGWTDMHAFVIADIFEACFKVLFLGPIIGIIFGLFGAAIAQFFVRKNLNR